MKMASFALLAHIVRRELPHLVLRIHTSQTKEVALAILAQLASNAF
jgi:hypothetical protein